MRGSFERFLGQRIVGQTRHEGNALARQPPASVHKSNGCRISPTTTEGTTPGACGRTRPARRQDAESWLYCRQVPCIGRGCQGGRRSHRRQFQKESEMNRPRNWLVTLLTASLVGISAGALAAAP